MQLLDLNTWCNYDTIYSFPVKSFFFHPPSAHPNRTRAQPPTAPRFPIPPRSSRQGGKSRREDIKEDLTEIIFQVATRKFGKELFNNFVGTFPTLPFFLLAQTTPTLRMVMNPLLTFKPS